MSALANALVQPLAAKLATPDGGSAYLESWPSSDGQPPVLDRPRSTTRPTACFAGASWSRRCSPRTRPDSTAASSRCGSRWSNWHAAPTPPPPDDRFFVRPSRGPRPRHCSPHRRRLGPCGSPPPAMPPSVRARARRPSAGRQVSLDHGFAVERPAMKSARAWTRLAGVRGARMLEQRVRAAGTASGRCAPRATASPTRAARRGAPSSTSADTPSAFAARGGRPASPCDHGRSSRPAARPGTRHQQRPLEDQCGESRCDRGTGTGGARGLRSSG